MLGRVVLVLCLIVGVAHACPPNDEARSSADAVNELPRAAAASDDATGAAVAFARAAVPSDDATGAAVAFGFMGMCLFAYAIMRGNAVRRTFATSRHLVDVDIDVLRRVARAQRARTGALAAICALAFYGAAQLPLPVEARVWLGLSPLLLLAVAVIALCQLELLIALRPEPGLKIAAHGHYIYVSREKRLVGWVAAPPKLLARATALPVATLRT
jgi:hypothetical protein